jgi:DNA polymerase-3 subunit beta
MKISTSKTELQSALQKLSKATPTRSTLPILTSVLFDAQEDGTVLRTTDLEIAIVVSLPASLEETGSCAIPIQPLVEITNALPETRITISIDDSNRIKMSTEIGEYDLSGKPSEEFPALPDVDNRKAAGIKGSILSEIIKTNLFAVSQDELKPALTGILFRFGDNMLTAVSTDGHRLVKYVRKDYESKEFQGDVVIPKKFLNMISNILPADEIIQVWMGESHMTLSIGSDTYFTRIIDERFPDYESVLPKENDKTVSVKKDDILSGVKRVSIFSNRSTHQIALDISEGKIVLTTEDPERASKAKEELVADLNGEGVTIGYNANYLKDVLSHIGTEDLRIELKSSISAGLFYPGKQEKNSDLTMLLMPIRLGD